MKTSPVSDSDTSFGQYWLVLSNVLDCSSSMMRIFEPEQDVRCIQGVDAISLPRTCDVKLTLRIEFSAGSVITVGLPVLVSVARDELNFRCQNIFRLAL